MICYSGIKTKNKIPFLLFTNVEKDETIEIPIDNLTAERISKYLERLGPVTESVEHGNDESLEEEQ